jgi:O-antigen ligase
MAQGAIRMYEDHFPFGAGGGNTRTFSPDYNFSLLGGLVSHSGYLDVLSELGIVGLLVYLGAIVSVYPALRIARFQIEPSDLRQTLGVAMIAAFLTVFLALGIGSWSGWSYFWMVLAIISTREWAFAPRESSQDSSLIGTVERCS